MPPQSFIPGFFQAGERMERSAMAGPEGSGNAPEVGRGEVSRLPNLFLNEV